MVDGQKVDGQKVEKCTRDKRSIYLRINETFLRDTYKIILHAFTKSSANACSLI